MICRRCLLLRRTAATHPNPPTRPFTHTPSPRTPQTVTAQTTTATNPRPHDLPAATSTSAAQPFSTPLTPSPERTGKQVKEEVVVRVQSSVPAGTVLKGLNFLKSERDPIALEDGEYPDWLWGVLEKKDGGGKGREGGKEEEGDLFSKSKKQRRLAAKALRKQQLLNPELLRPKVPLYEQSVDLPAGDGALQGSKEAAGAREELTQAMRKHRRAKIKEANFLKGMR